MGRVAMVWRRHLGSLGQNYLSARMQLFLYFSIMYDFTCISWISSPWACYSQDNMVPFHRRYHSGKLTAYLLYKRLAGQNRIQKYQGSYYKTW
jgi:hypothetical protein